MAEKNTWKPRENLGNAKDLVREFEKEYGKIERKKKKRNDKKEGKGELPDKYMAKMLYRWDNKRFNKEYWGQFGRNWRK